MFETVRLLKGEKGENGDKGDKGDKGEVGVVVRNLLDNSDFTNPVNQRGNSYYSGNWTYSIDRWIVVTDNAEGESIWVDDGYINMPYYADLQQKIPLEPLKGKTFTFAVCNSEEIVTVKVVVPKNPGTDLEYYGTNWGETSTLLEVFKYANDDMLMLRIRNTYNGLRAFYWAALYEGEFTADTLPPYVPKGYAAELAECQRYYKRIAHSNSVYDVCLNGCLTDSAKVLFLNVPIEDMRTIPTGTITGGVIVRGVSGYIDNSSSGIALVVYACKKGSVCLKREDGAAFSVNAVNNTPIQINMPSGSKIEFSADL